ncbi:MAG: hypothetical protein ABFS42_00910 [Candidatus Krumholzibacteriota bacterium]
MKTIRFAAWVLAVLYLLVPKPGFPQFPSLPNNQVGLFMTADGTGATGTTDIGVPVSVFLVLINPTDAENADAPYATINAFECMLNITGPALFMLAEILSPTAVNEGDASDINQGFLEYIVSLGTSLEVISGAATLISFQFMTVSPLPTVISLSPTNDPSIPGEMVFQSVPGQLRTMHIDSETPCGGYFCFNNCCGLPVDDESFGSVKTLYR